MSSDRAGPLYIQTLGMPRQVPPVTVASLPLGRRSSNPSRPVTKGRRRAYFCNSESKKRVIDVARGAPDPPRLGAVRRSLVEMSPGVRLALWPLVVLLTS